ncbi:MAG: hypothetical protein ACREQO_20800 [Candidatus Binatia bacterium]
MDQLYKSRRIQTLPQLSPNADCWIPQAVVSWDQQGSAQRHVLTGPADRFALIDHAETYALEMAIAWIDDGEMQDLTP